jgi:4-amino-4-deoxy-L-arabinose transferase-like glycosyltransferase
MPHQSNKISWVKEKYRHLVALLTVFIFYNSFFLNKAFHIDDPYVIAIARAINRDFLKVPIELFLSNPLLLGYYYAPVIRFFGEKEIWMHIFYLPFSLLAIIAMFILSRRFTGEGLLPALSLVISPAFLVMSHNIMLDIPVLAFSLAALAAFIYGTDKNDNRLLFLSGILIAIASLIKYSGLIFIPIMLIYALLSSKRKFCLFLIIPVLIFFIWGIHIKMLYKTFPFMAASLMRVKMWSIDEILTRSFACLSFLTGTSIISLFLIPFLLRKRNNLILLISSFPLGLCPFLFKGVFNNYSCSEIFFLAVLFISSIFIILIILKNGLLALFENSNKDNLFLSLWFMIGLVFIISAQFVSARFVLILLPPMFLLIYKELINQPIYFFNSARKIILFFVAVVFFISTILAVGDYRFAGAYRDFPANLKGKFTQNEHPYFCTATYLNYYAWGYSYYINKYFPKIENNNIKDNLGKIQDVFFVTPKEPVLPLIIQNICPAAEGSTMKFNLVFINRLDYQSKVFLHNRKHRTGFYSHHWGLLPFKIFWQESTLEEFNTYKLELVEQD